MRVILIAACAATFLFFGCGPKTTGTTASIEERQAIDDYFGDILPAAVNGYLSSDSEVQAFNQYMFRIVDEFDKTTADLSMEERVQKQVELSCYFMSFVKVPKDTIGDWESIPESQLLDEFVNYLEPILEGPDSFYVNSVQFARTVEALSFTFKYRYAEQQPWNPNSEEFKFFTQLMDSECERAKDFLTFSSIFSFYPTLVAMGKIE